MTTKKNDPIDLNEKRARRRGTVDSFGIAVEFDRDSEDFVLGVEVGILLIRPEARPPTWRGTYHAENRTMLERVARSAGYSVEILDSGAEGWVFADFVRQDPPKGRPVVSSRLGH